MVDQLQTSVGRRIHRVISASEVKFVYPPGQLKMPINRRFYSTGDDSSAELWKVNYN